MYSYEQAIAMSEEHLNMATEVLDMLIGPTTDTSKKAEVELTHAHAAAVIGAGWAQLASALAARETASGSE